MIAALNCHDQGQQCIWLCFNHTSFLKVHLYIRYGHPLRSDTVAVHLLPSINGLHMSLVHVIRLDVTKTLDFHSMFTLSGVSPLETRGQPRPLDLLGTGGRRRRRVVSVHNGRSRVCLSCFCQGHHGRSVPGCGPSRTSVSRAASRHNLCSVCFFRCSSSCLMSRCVLLTERPFF